MTKIKQWTRALVDRVLRRNTIAQSQIRPLAGGWDDDEPVVIEPNVGG